MFLSIQRFTAMETWAVTALSHNGSIERQSPARHRGHPLEPLPIDGYIGEVRSGSRDPTLFAHRCSQLLPMASDGR
jgi:hypothetical protein